jgi:redox-sensitive bicupin YhaK (pirin superfamily)
MEIVSYVLEGALGHQDSIGNGATIRPGDVQRMSAGSGIRHSEFNHAADATTHFLQIWILPEARDLEPGYEQKHFPAESKRGVLKLVAAPDGRDGAVRLNADAAIYAGLFDGDERAELVLDPRRLGYVHVVRGALSVNGQRLEAGDAVQLDGEPRLLLAEGRDAEVLVFDLQR